MNNDLNIILENAIILIEVDEYRCLFEALGKASGSSWNGGFGTAETAVCLDHPDGKANAHFAYAAVRWAIGQHSKGKLGQMLMCFSEKASKEDKIEALNLAKKFANDKESQ
jgi:hypothetical protein